MEDPKQIFTKQLMVDSYLKSPYRGYQELAVGRPGLLALLKYELLTLPFSGFPGAMGYYLRGRFARHLFKRAGARSVYGNHIKIFSPHRISVGRQVMISDGCRLDVKGEGQTGITLGEKVLIGANTILRSRFGGTIDIGDNVNVGDNSLIASRNSEVKIGKNVLIGAYCYIMGGGAHKFERIDVPIWEQGLMPAQDVTIGDDVWIGAGAKILYGVTIGRGCVIGAGAVVNQDIPEMSVAAGIPARVIKERN